MEKTNWKRELGRLTPESRAIFERLPEKDREDAWRAASRLKGTPSWRIDEQSEPGSPKIYEVSLWDPVDHGRVTKNSSKTLSAAFREVGKLAFDWHREDMIAYLADFKALARANDPELTDEQVDELYSAQLSTLLKG